MTSKHLLQRVFSVNFHCTAFVSHAHIHVCSLHTHTRVLPRTHMCVFSARRTVERPERIWSPQQLDALEIIADATAVSDANTENYNSRVLHIRGGPGTGKTEVVIEATLRALADGCNVLIVGPIGLLVSMYRQRLPASPNLTMETLHSAFRITRKADEVYIPPGRLRAYDLIIIDEVSQVDGKVWRQMQTAIVELMPKPFIVLVGDFQQLQPITGPHLLRDDLEEQHQRNQVRVVELLQHQAARSTDPVMLDFLEAARTRQPTKAELSAFFRGRVWSKDTRQAARQAMHLEQERGKDFTFLTVTNKGAAQLNLARLEIEFPQEAATLNQGGGLPADSSSGQTAIVVRTGMRLRLTRNLDKDRGFVDGAMGRVSKLLRKDIFVLTTTQGVRLLVHPITMDGSKFMPACYAYATTMRRAQGATLPLIGLLFDRRLPDRGYAYVGVSRTTTRSNTFLLGKIRRTDWLPVGGHAQAEQTYPGDSSYTTDSELDRPDDSSDQASDGSTRTASQDSSTPSQSERTMSSRCFSDSWCSRSPEFSRSESSAAS